jgi:hypothetical protein
MLILDCSEKSWHSGVDSIRPKSKKLSPRRPRRTRRGIPSGQVSDLPRKTHNLHAWSGLLPGRLRLNMDSPRLRHWTPGPMPQQPFASCASCTSWFKALRPQAAGLWELYEHPTGMNRIQNGSTPMHLWPLPRLQMRLWIKNPIARTTKATKNTKGNSVGSGLRPAPKNPQSACLERPFAGAPPSEHEALDPWANASRAFCFVCFVRFVVQSLGFEVLSPARRLLAELLCLS